MRTLLLLGMAFLCTAIHAQNQPPVTADDTLFANLHEIHYVNVLANDSDPDGDSLGIMLPAHTDNNLLIVNLGADDYYGLSGWLDPITYRVRDYDPATGQPNSMGTTGKLHIYIENPSFDYVDANNIKARINGCGNHFWDFQGKNEFYAPKDSLTTTLFNSVMWFGAKNNSDLYVSGDRYGQRDDTRFWAGPVSDHYAGDFCQTWDRVWKINRWDIQYHQAHYQDAGYTPHPRIADWPAHGDVNIGQSAIIAPFEDLNGNGIYEPMQGDYPKIKGDQAIFFVYNDDQFKDSANTHQFKNMRLEIRGMAYAFDGSHDDTLQNTLFMYYEVENKSNRNYTDAYIGNFTDIDLGYAMDDYVGCDVANGAFYGYNGSNVDGNGLPNHYGANPPAVGIQILAGPEKDADGQDNPRLDNNNLQLCDESINGYGYGNGIADDERLGMSYFMYFNNSGAGTSPMFVDPKSPADYYSYLTGHWLDNTQMLYGGNGHASTGAVGPVARYMFPGNTDTCNYGTGGVAPNYGQPWVEATVANQPYDRRGMASSGPFTFNSGDVKHFDMAFVYARTPGASGNPVAQLMDQMSYLKNRFETDSIFDFYTGIEDVALEGNEILFNVYPNPGKDNIVVEVANTSNDAYISIYNTQSQLVKKVKVSNVKTSVATLDLARGLYIITISDGTSLGSRKWIKM